MQLKFVALKWAITEKFSKYLFGKKCVVFTDNNPLSYLTSAKLGSTEQHWAAQLAAFDFDIKYHSGKSNTDADMLSWQDPLEAGVLDGLVPGTAIPESLRQIAGLDLVGIMNQCLVTMLPDYSVGELGLLQAADAVIRVVLQFWR